MTKKMLLPVEVQVKDLAPAAQDFLHGLENFINGRDKAAISMEGVLDALINAVAIIGIGLEVGEHLPEAIRQCVDMLKARAEGRAPAPSGGFVS